jgi:hypothetical protein
MISMQIVVLNASNRSCKVPVLSTSNGRVLVIRVLSWRGILSDGYNIQDRLKFWAFLGLARGRKMMQTPHQRSIGGQFTVIPAPISCIKAMQLKRS